MRTSLYADDLALFVNPVQEDMPMVGLILRIFQEVTGLHTNFAKSVALPIRCDGLDLQQVLLPLGVPIGTFPSTYLGMALCVKKLLKIHYLNIMSKFDNRMAGWKGKLMSKGDSLTLAKAGMAPRDTPPNLFAGSSRKGRTVHDALLRDNWVHDLQRNWRDDMIDELINLSNLLDQTHLSTTIRDSIAWKLTTDVTYSARSAYLFQFECMINYNLYTSIWRTWAPPKCKIFLWMAMQKKILTADVLLLRGWDNNYFCPLCICCLETAAHLLCECSWPRNVWVAMAVSAGRPSLQPASWMAERSLSD
ncbi:hypothetical protein D1007_34420 [Hordeum vulgare]|nr:hypothetical protein D1007_34420 [Hordeum vulgare]